ncbi:DUF1998 domain-containing protein [Spongiactinospora sp. TRM90649]|uniref:DUF1998 domain-containing protein n=1 Tax=Spongiactinospora sp. TRM90649 TaxID=3031114 RepID=UPI0023F6CC90|nr:DUF1998 domain-containing protein [Spongiactinospora sp. TRM90649]MDF5755567.1 DUF1998 domain-containing protein [Spongiactinospora sp. TRM90649]
MSGSSMRVGELRPNQLLHTYGVGAVADMPNLSVMVCGLDDWSPNAGQAIPEERLLAAVRAKLGPTVQRLLPPPYVPETADPFGEWTRVGVPVTLFPRWLRCTNSKCGLLAPVETGLFELLPHAFSPDRIRYVHGCRGRGGSRPTAVPARFVLACRRGHLDDFPWLYFVHLGGVPEFGGHTLTLEEQSTTGDAASLWVICSCGARRSMAQAIGETMVGNLPLCRGRHPHLRAEQFRGCGEETRTMGLGATNGWFGMQLKAFTLPRADIEIDQRVAELWNMLELVSMLPEEQGRRLLTDLRCWGELEHFGVDEVWKAIRRHTEDGTDTAQHDELDLMTPEWNAFTRPGAVRLDDFTTEKERPPGETRPWLQEVILVTRLRQVSALYGFTRIDAPEWGDDTASPDFAPLSVAPPTWVPCAELRGEGIFLRFREDELARWESRPDVRERGALLRAGHDRWRAQRRLEPGHWPGLRYILLHSFAHALIREFALESGYSAAGIGERIYSGTGADPMAGVLLYTAAPDSEGTLGGLVTLGRRDRLGTLIGQALDAARLCSSDPLCSEHDPREHGHLYGSACHACLFASETSCERGNHYLDRALLVDTVRDLGIAYLAAS